LLKTLQSQEFTLEIQQGKRSKIPFIKPDSPSWDVFEKHMMDSVSENTYSNFGPNEKKLKIELDSIVGYPCILVSNATMAIEGMHNILSRYCDHAYVPGFTFLATNLSAPSNVEVMKTDCEENIGFHIFPEDIKHNSYLMTVAPFGAKKPECFRSDGKGRLRYWIVDAAASPLCYLKDWLESGADAVIVSFHATKILSACEGGAIFFRNLQLKSEYEKYINFGLYYSNGEKNERFTLGRGSNHKMSELSASWCLAGLNTIYKKSLHRRFEQMAKFKKIAIECGNKYIESPSSFWIQTKNKASEAAEEIFRKYNIECKRYYYPILNRSKSAFVLSEYGLCLPSYPMSDEDFEYVLDSLKEYLKGI